MRAVLKHEVREEARSLEDWLLPRCTLAEYGARAMRTFRHSLVSDAVTIVY
jgi:hypothetical protein